MIVIEPNCSWTFFSAIGAYEAFEVKIAVGVEEVIKMLQQFK